MKNEPIFKASARVLLTAPDDVMKRLCDHMAEHGDVSLSDRKARIDTFYGSAALEAHDDALTLHAEGDDEVNFAYVKLSLAEHLLEFAPGENPSIVWSGDTFAGSPLPYFREMRVVGAQSITPHMRRVTLAGENLARFETGGLHIRLLFPPKGVETPQWPVTGEDGRPSWPKGTERPAARVYTIRNIDAAKGEVEIDMVLHEGAETPGATFAAEAVAGDIVGMTGPGGGWIEVADWHLLAGDETALPAIGRILEKLPETAKVTALIEVADTTEEQALPTAANLDLRWLHRNGAEAGTTTLLEDAIRAVEWPAVEDGKRAFAWVGCEHKAFRAIRKHLRSERKLAREDHLVVAYWRRGFDGDNARNEE